MNPTDGIDRAIASATSEERQAEIRNALSGALHDIANPVLDVFHDECEEIADALAPFLARKYPKTPWEGIEAIGRAFVLRLNRKKDAT